MRVLKNKSILVCVSLVFLVVMAASISNAAIDPGVIEGVWLFDEGSGDVARDSSGNGLHGDIVGGAGWVDGVFGKALEFDGVDDDVTVSSYMGVGGTNPRTVCLWFKGDAAIEHSWVKWGVNVAGQKYYVRAHLAAPECYLRVEVNGGQCYGVTNVCDNQWHHLAVVFPDGSDSVKDHLLYVDGVLEGDHLGTDQDMDTSNDTQEIHIGAPLENHVHVNGMMDEVAILSAALSADDIVDVKENGLGKALTVVGPIEKLSTTWSNVKSQY